MGVAGRLTRRVIQLGLALLALSVAAVLYFAERNMEHHGDGRSLEAPIDAIIVLGGGADGDGAVGYSSRRRVATGVALMKAGKARKLILSGGTKDFGIAPIADLMRDYAIALGVPADALLVETQSVSTFENLRFSFELAEAHGLEDLAIATDAFHLERAGWLASYLGRPGIGLVAVPGLAHEPRVSQAGMILREAMALWFNLAKVLGWEGLAAAGMPPEAIQEWIR